MARLITNRASPIQPITIPALAIPCPSVIRAALYSRSAILPQMIPGILPSGPRKTKQIDRMSDASAQLLVAPKLVWASDGIALGFWQNVKGHTRPEGRALSEKEGTES